MQVLPSGFAIVADKRGIKESLELIEGRAEFVGLKLHPSWAVAASCHEEYDTLRRHDNLVQIIDAQFSPMQGHTGRWLDLWQRLRIQPNAVTIERGLSYDEIAFLVDECRTYYSDVTVCMTGTLPETPLEDVNRFGGVDEYLGRLCEIGRKLGNMGLYAASEDFANIDASGVLRVAVGVSRDGEPYGIKSQKRRGITTPDRARRLADIVCLGSCLDDSPEDFLNKIAPVTNC